MSKAIETAFAKFAVAFVAVAMLISLVAPAAQAQTTEELQQMINDLLAQVASLQGQLGGGDSMMASGICPGTVWTRSLSVGDSGPDVMKLQQFLNSDPETRVAASGVGSAGMETDYFGGLTGAAVAKFQTKYRSEVLTPLGLVNATQYFGPKTMAHANQLCAAASSDDHGDDHGDDMTDDEDTDSSDDEEMDDEDNGSLSGNEASLEDFDLKDGDDTELQEGQENAPVADAEFDVEDGDIELERVDVAVDFTGDNDDEDDPWDVFETVSLWVDGDMIAEIDSSDEDEWEEDTPATGDWRLRFTGLDQVFREGDQAEITIGVSLNGSIDLGGDDASTWDIFIPTNGVRGRDGADVDQFTGDTSDTVEIDIQQEGADDEVIFKASTNDPDSTTLQLEDGEKSDWITVFIFDIDTDDSTNDIEVEGLIVNVDAEDPNGDDKNTSNYINDARLVVDGKTFDDVTITHGTTTGTFDFDFDNNEFVIDAGDRQEVEFQLEFKAMSSTTLEGSTIVADIDSADSENEFEGAETVVDEGSSTGEEHTLRTTGAILELVSTDETFVENSDSTTADNEGTFELVFDVTAFEQDVYIESNTPTEGTTESNTGVNYQVISGGSATTGASVSANLDSDADEETNGSGTFFRVNEGETERFTLTVDFDPATGNEGKFFKVQLYSVNFNDSAADADTQQLAIPTSDFDTDALSI